MTTVATPHNSVMALRERELLASKRVFLARGAKLKRCPACLLAEQHCICASKPNPQSGAAFCLLMYKGEAYKPSNTGRIIADVMADNHAFLWQRTEADPALLTLLSNPVYAPILIFPHQYVAPERCIGSKADIDRVCASKTPLFVLLDGTWREAKKMLKSPYLQSLPVLGIAPEQASDYRLREAAHLHQLCTAEVAIAVLQLAELTPASQALQQYFRAFRAAYLKTKPHLDPDQQKAP